MAKVPPSIRTRLDPISVALDIPSASLEMSPAAEAATSASCNLRRTGNVYVIQVKDEDPACEEHPVYNVVKTLTFSYDGSEQLRLAVLGQCDPNDAGRAVWSSYKPLAAREFKYDPMAGPRARHLVADYDPTAEPDDPSQWTLLTPVGATDYNGVSPYGDAELTLVNGDWQWTNTVRYPWPGSQQTVSNGAQQYGHADLIGSNMLTSDANASAVSRVAYSAFGEVLTAAGAPGGVAPSDFPRYQYAGEFGYESGLLSVQGVNTSLPPITLQHLGARWYQPDLGRFVQRDPIGLEGGVNVYVYVLNEPDAQVDPDGLFTDWDLENRGRTHWPPPGGGFRPLVIIPAPGTSIIGKVFYIRVPKGESLLNRGKLSTKNWLASELIRRGLGGAGNLVRYTGKYVSCGAMALDLLSLSGHGGPHTGIPWIDDPSLGWPDESEDE